MLNKAYRGVILGKIKIALLFTVVLLSIVSKADIWVATEVWTPEKEVQYQTWIQKFAQIDMFSKPLMADGTANPYYGLTTDCADTVYALRIIFSYENKLPWAMRDPMDRTKLITNELKRFDHIPEENSQRLHRFIRYMTNTVSTYTISNDTYPISINQIVPGAVILTSRKNHHSWTIAQIMPNGNPRLIYNSTVGAQSGSKVQERWSWPNPYWIFEPEEKLVDKNNPDAGIILKPVYYPGSYAGIRYWIPVDKLLTDMKQLDAYSTDQYNLDLSKWKAELTRRLALRNETVPEVVQRLLVDVCADIKQRVTAVREAEEYKKQIQQALFLADTPALARLLAEYNASLDKSENPLCLIKARYNEFSTPSRDRRLFDALILARSYFQFGIRTQGEQIFPKKALRQFKKIFPNALLPAKEESAAENIELAIDANSICKIKVDEKMIDMAEVKRRLFRSYVSPNPNADVVGRWGGNGDVVSDLVNSCPTYGDVYTAYDIERSERESFAEVDVYSKVNVTNPVPVPVPPPVDPAPAPVVKPVPTPVPVQPEPPKEVTPQPEPVPEPVPVPNPPRAV